MPPEKHPSHAKNQQLRYLGFSVVPDGREYTFQLAIQGLPDRAFTVIVNTVGFVAGKLKYQEGPSISYWKLVGALATEITDSPLCVPQRVTEAEVEDYSVSSRTKGKSRVDAIRAEAKLRDRAQLAERRG